MGKCRGADGCCDDHQCGRKRCKFIKRLSPRERQGCLFIVSELILGLAFMVQVRGWGWGWGWTQGWYSCARM